MLSAPLGRGALVLWFLAGSIFACAQPEPTPQQKQPASAHSSLPSVAPVQTPRAASTQTATASTANWQPIGPLQVETPAYGLVTGRISSIAVDPNDPSGNTVYIGATGGGVWKSVNAAGASGGVTFTSLTDNIQPFVRSATSGATSIPSLSIGALSVEPGNPQVLLAGTGDPNDALDSYYGVGILRSGDGGNTWTLISENSDQVDDANYDFLGLAFSGFAWSTAKPNLVVAAASHAVEGLIVNVGTNATAEAGLYYSTDAGLTWHLATITDGPNQIIQSADPPTAPPGNAVTSVVWNPQRGLFLAAVQFHGYYSSTDGMTWTRLANQPGPSLSPAQCPTNPRNTGSQSCPIFHGVLAVQPATGDTFALTTDINNLDQGLYRDVCSTTGQAVSSCSSSTITFGKHINDAPLDTSGGAIPQADYNLALSTAPSQQDTILLAGAQDIFRCSLAAGCVWRNTTNVQTCAAGQVAPSIHAIDATFGANGLAYFGADGGLWRTTDLVAQTGSVCAATDASHFQNLNAGLGSLAEITHLAVSPESPAGNPLILAGMGAFGVVSDQSSAAQSGTGSWQQVLTGDGGYVAIDPLSPSDWYANAGAPVSIFHCPNGENCNAAAFGTTPAIDRSQVADDADYFWDPAPWLLDPLDSSNILLGTCRVWMGPAAGGWTSANLVSPILDGGHSASCDGDAQLRAVGAGGSYNSAQGGEQVYAGMAGPLDGGGAVPGHLYGATVPQGGGVVPWTDLWRNPVVNRSLSSQFNEGGYAISAIAVDPHDPTGKTLYVAISGFPVDQSGELYTSTDGGAHWTNINSSLPAVPLNSVVVDPNNPSWVYVGGDAGVFYTSNVANCGVSGQLCWAQLGSGLPNAPVTDLKLAPGNPNPVLVAATYGRGIWMLGLSTTSVSPQASLTPTSQSFPAEGVGASGSPVSFTLQNTGSLQLNISQVSASTADYSETNDCGSSLAVNAFCTIQVTFQPTATGDRPGALTVRANTQSGALSASLDGTGLTPGNIIPSTANLSFPPTAINAPSQPRSLTLHNTGDATVQIQSTSILGTNPGDFSVPSGACGSSLAAGQSCSIPVTFTPSALGSRAATLQIAASATGSPFNVNLSGTGANPPQLVLTPQSLTFPATTKGSDSPEQAITVTNQGGLPAQLGTAGLSTDYIFASDSPNPCGSSLAATASCIEEIEFAPTTTGDRTGLFTLTSPDAPNGQLTAPLDGAGLSPASLTASPGSLSFSNQQQGVTSTVQTFTITNNGQSAAQLAAPTTTSDYAIASNSCGSSIAAGANNACTIGITFTPSQAGSRPGVFTQLYGNSTLTVNLTGTGTTPGFLTFSPSPFTFPTTAENTTSSLQTVTVTNGGQNPARITAITPSGPFGIANSNCPTSPTTLAVNASCVVNLAFTPPGAAAYTGNLTLTGSFSNTPASVPLIGQGAAPSAATLTPSSLSFPDTPQGSASSPQNITLASTGGVALSITSITVSTDYQIAANPCPASLASGSNCVLSVLFHPVGIGGRPGTLSVAGSMQNSPLIAQVSGNGLPPGVISLSPQTLNFGSAVTGSTTPSQTVTVGNTGGSPAALGAPSITGETGDFAVTGSTCGATLAVGHACTLSVDFSPTIAGSRSGLLTVPGDGSGSSASVTLNGTGATPGQITFSPPSVAFGNVATGSSATTTPPITVTNTGGTALHISAITTGGDFSVTGGTCTASLTLQPTDSCTVAVMFTPSTLGPRTGTLTLTGDGSPTAAQEPLSGIGVQPGYVTFSSASVSFGSVVINTSVQQSITATNTGGVPVTLGNASVAPVANYSLTENPCGASLAAKATCTLQITFTPTATGDIPGQITLPWGSGATATAALDGQGVTPGALTFTTGAVNFGQVVTGATATQTTVLKNTGGAPVTLGSPTAGSPYGVTGSCASPLAPGATCSLSVSFSPTSVGQISGLLTAPSSVGDAADALSGDGILPGKLAASPLSLRFSPTEEGLSTATQTVTFSNPGGVGVPLSAPQLSTTDYAVTATTCGSSLAPGGDCNVTVEFTPKAAGDRQATLTLASSAANGPAAAATLDGTGLAHAQLTFSPASLNFGSQPDHTASASRTLTLTNSGGVTTSLGLPVLGGPYAIAANTCSNSLLPSSTCTIVVQFLPTGSGTQSGSISIASATGTPSATAALTGVAQALVLSPTAISFTPPLAIGSTSTPVLIVIEDLGAAPFTLGAPTITGPNAGDFALGSSACGATLPANASCAINATFQPTAGGLRTGVFTVSVGSETQSVQLSGTGLSPATDTLSPTSLTFGPTVFGHASAGQSVQLANTGDATLAQLTVSTAGPYQAVNNCGPSLGGHLNCSIEVTFIPTAVGSQTGTLTVTDAQRAQTIPLTGQGTAPPQAFASPANIDFGPYALAVATTPQTVSVSNQGTTSIENISIALSSPDFSLSSNTCASTLAPGAACQLGVSFTPGAIGNRQGVLTLSSPSLTEPLTVSLTGSGEDFQIGVVGAATQVITEGQTATYQLSITPVGASAGSLSLACSGAPANAVCTVNPATLSIAGTATGSLTLSVATSTSAATATASNRGAGRWWPAGVALSLLCPVLLTGKKQRRRLLLLLLAAALLASPIACGVHASGTASTAATQPGHTASGSYNLTVTAGFPGAQRTAGVTLVVQ